MRKSNAQSFQATRDLLLDSSLMPDFRQSAAFRLMDSEKGIAELTALLSHSDVVVRRCVLFAFDELTELTEIPQPVKQAVPSLKQLLKDQDEVVRGMTEEVLEQIESHQRTRTKS
jgi:HEAT repeat protein